MPLSHIEHFLIQTADIEATCDWYERVLGMRRGHTPDFKFPVQWLYIGNSAVVHVALGGVDTGANRKRYLGQQSDALEGTGVIDHVAFRATGLGEMIAHLKMQGIEFTQRQVDDAGLYQVFLFDPNGVKLELNFANAEAVASGIRPELMASDLLE